MMEAKPGTYALVFQSDLNRSVQIGKRGALAIVPGVYVYVGSAFGPGGLRARVGRHLMKNKKRRWHIDYLRSEIEPVEVWFTYHPQKQEHRWASTLASMRTASIPLPGFGSSDCECKSHLFHFKRPPSFASFKKRAIGAIQRETPEAGAWQKETKKRMLEKQVEAYYGALSNEEREEDRQWREIAAQSATPLWE